MGTIRRTLLWAAIGLAGWLAIFYLVPDWRPHLEEEDHFGENVTAVILGVTFLMGVVLAFVLKPRREKFLALGIGLLMGIAFGDEISYGERLFGLSMPTIGETRFDGLHDIVQIVWDQKVVVVLMVVAAAAAIWKWRLPLAARLRSYLQVPALRAILMAFAFTGVALFLDLHIIEFPARHASEEYFELLAALMMGVGLLLLWRHGLPGRESEEILELEPALVDSEKAAV